MKKELIESISEFCSEIINEPLTFFNEHDLQALLYHYLLTKLPTKHKTGYARGKGSKSRYKTSSVHREYGAGAKKRIDLVLLDKNEIAKIDSPNLTVKGKYIKPEYGIELGTHKTVNIYKHLTNDILKLKNANNGIIICFHRDGAVSGRKTPRSKVTLATIQKKYLSAISKGMSMIKHKIIYLIFILSPQKVVKANKCIYLNSDTPTFKNLNIGKSKTMVELFLKKHL